MNLEDETLLSAFLDDELDAPRRAEVEAVLRSNPRLSRQLRDLSATRDLVAGLGRPSAPAGLTDAVLARLGRRHASAPGRLLSSTLRLPVPFLAGAAASLAAGVVIAVSLTMSGARASREKAPASSPELAQRDKKPPARPEGPRPVDRIHEQPADDAPAERRDGHADEALGIRDSESSAVSAKLGDAVADRPAAAPALATEKPAAPAATTTPVASAPVRSQFQDGKDVVARERLKEPNDAARAGAAVALNRPDQDEDGRRDLAAMLRRPGVLRMMVVADVVDSRTIEAFDDVLRNAQLKHPRQGRIAIAQAILRDPGQPDGQGVIFAIAMDAAERGKLRKALAAKFPRSEVREDSAPPAVANQLAAEVGKFEVFDVEAAAGLTNSGPLDRQNFAIRTEPANANNDFQNSVAKKLATARGVEPEQVATTADSSSKAESAAPSRDETGVGIERKLAKAKAANDPEAAKSPMGGVGGGAEALRNSGLARVEAGRKAGAFGQMPADNGRRAPAEPEMVLVWLTARPPR